MISTALFLALATHPLVTLADGTAVGQGQPVVVEWLTGPLVVGRSTATIRDGRLELPERPPQSKSLRVAGPELMSRELSLGPGQPSRIVLVRGSFVATPEGLAGRLHLLDLGSPSAVPESRLVGPESRGPHLVWPGHYAIAFDTGPGRPIEAVSRELAPADRFELSLASPQAVVRLQVLCRDEKGAPVPGMTLRIPSDGDRTKLLSIFALRARSGTSNESGVLDLGALQAGSGPLRLEKPGRRDAVVNVPDQPAPSIQTIVATSRPYAGLALRWIDHVAGSSVGAERCETPGTPDRCTYWKREGTAPFDGRGRGRFSSLKPGWHRLSLLMPAGRASLAQRDIEIPWNSAEPDPPEVVFEPEEWRLSGLVEDRDGRPIADASVYASPLVSSGIAPAALVEGRTSADGSFSLSFFSSTERIGLAAETDDPLGATEFLALGSQERMKSDFRLVMLPGGVRVHVEDRATGAPIESCPVSAKSGHAGSTVVQSKRTDRQGKAVFRGTRDSIVVVQVSCPGYAPTQGTAIEPDPQGAEATIRVEKTDRVSLRAIDPAGRSVVGARVLVPEPGSSLDAFQAPVMEAGITGVDGRLELGGDQFASLPAFVLAPGRALGLARLPAARCSSDDCEVQVVLQAPTAFAGVSASTASGKPLPPIGLVFTLSGIPLPVSLVREMATAHGFPPTGFVVGGSAGSNLLPGYLPPGEYEVSYLIGSRQTRAIRALPAGFLRVPASSLVDLRVDAIP